MRPGCEEISKRLIVFCDLSSQEDDKFHDLRATWATIMISKGIPPIKVMAMAGWKELKTMQFYIRKAGHSTLDRTWRSYKQKQKFHL